MTQPATTKRKGFRPITYIGEIITELKKVVWLTRREIVYLTGLVLIVTIAAGVLLGALDFGFTQIMNALFG
jgi:preprotein translocase subunit SecE